MTSLKTRIYIALGLLAVTVGGYSLGAGRTSRLYQVYAEYIGTIKAGREVELDVWARRFEDALAADNEADANIRLTVLDELGAIYRRIQKPEKAVATYERMFSEAARSNDADGKVTALLNLMAIYRTVLEPSAEQLQLYDTYQKILADPPPEYRERFAKLLIDSYYDEARFCMRLADKAESEAAKLTLLNRARDNFTTFLANADSQTVNNPDTARYHLADVLKKLGDPEAAADIYTYLSENSKTFAASWMFHEAIKLRYGTLSIEYQQALSEYLASHEEDGYFGPAYQALAMSYLATGKGASAIPIMEKLVSETRDQDLLAYNTYLLGASYIDAGLQDKGIAILEDLIKTFPDSSSVVIAKELINRVRTGHANFTEFIRAQMRRVSHIADKAVGERLPQAGEGAVGGGRVENTTPPVPGSNEPEKGADANQAAAATGDGITGVTGYRRKHRALLVAGATGGVLVVGLIVGALSLYNKRASKGKLKNEE